MTPADLAAAGRLLCGERWKVPLARLLERDPRLVHHWDKGTRPMPAWIGPRLVELLKKRGGECWELAARLDVEPPEGIEPSTRRLRGGCSTD